VGHEHHVGVVPHHGSRPVDVDMQDALSQRTTAFGSRRVEIPGAEDGRLEVGMRGIVEIR